MNRIIWNITMFGLLTMLGACEGFLDRQPLDQLTDENFYQNESQANQAIISVYTPMMDQEWTGKGWMITEIPSDNTQPGGTDPEFTPIDNFTVAADNQPIANYWAIHYRQVALANLVMDRIANTDLEESKKTRMEAELRFLRAVAYFDLVRIYGGVPLIVDAPAYGEEMLFPRAGVREVYDQIVEDFQFAEMHLPVAWSGADVGRATAGAAMAFLAKVFLTRRDYLNSRNYAKAVMDLDEYRLMEDYADNFELATTDNNKESIFQVQFTGCESFGTGNPQQAFFAPWGEGITKDRDGWGSQIPTGPQLSNPTTTIFEAFEEGDLRKDPTIMTPNVHYPTINPDDGGYTYPSNGASATTCNIKKYVVGSGPNICFMSTPQNHHVIRYADVLLIYAESIMEIEGGISSNGDALNAFNEVRIRAGLEPLAQIDREIMLHERRVEFAFEGQRWFDLIRSGQAVEILTLHGKNITQNNLLFPIPSSERQINPLLEQNPGY
ncbi:RagB/SusD family nutrient uptake outer membrane protein [Pontibacter sp. G13]|uniref:RagB/SusD family nutrient uptake outer membrane protein n=1 Tax=Pontibacter sp. G13 TaxID=3074898 RepID=UPI00288BD9B8|nr:RagB/SusD family nutrient uptake outer membrane protein [Pontibacter sp. G13]WNJ19694.1 RagB/SusD family nutrient uptake outer membrane protein [Pontibacter sp. G13]